jgi:PBP1b-binding outer membrane lipoprotein LpoB
MYYKEKTMKKASILVVLAAAVVLSSCSTYTCPTYSKAPQEKAAGRI